MSKVSPHEEKMLNLRMQMQHNNNDLAEYIKDLDSWEKDIKKKEKNIKVEETGKQSADLPPVRNSVNKKKLKKKKKETPATSVGKTNKISGFDFKAWDKFDVDAALEEIDQEDEKKKVDTSSSEYETDEEWEIERKKYLASQEKDKGNEFLKKGDYDKAIEHYSKGIQYDPTNAIISANRAMALLKQQKFAAAEFDCTTSITLDPMYVKAYLRRATARAGAGKMEEAVADFNRVLDLEPTNKQAKTEIERIQKEVHRSKEIPVATTLVEDECGRVKPIYKAPEERSKKPLFRVPIEEIGIETTARPTPSTEQSELSKKITEKEKEEFDKLFVSSNDSDRPSVTKTEESRIPKIQDITEDSDNNNCDNDPSSSDKTSHQSKPNSPKTEAQVPTVSLAKSTSKKAKKPSSKLAVPQSSFQFIADFKHLRHDTAAFFHYFKAISPENYQKLFGRSFDADILINVLKALSLHPEEVDLYNILLNLSKVERFSIFAMFMTRRDKQVAEELFSSIDTRDHSESEISALRKLYDL